MKQISSILVALGALATASQVFAADIPGRRGANAPAPVYAEAPPLFTWTGFYAGVNAGYGFSSKNRASYTGDAAYVAQGANAPRSYNLKRNGFVGGGTLGYNIQSGRFVGGVEADLNGAGGSNKSQTVIAPNATGIAKSQLGAFGTLRARAGVLATDRWFLYGTAGVMIAQTKFSNSLAGTAAPMTPGGTWSGTGDKTKVGLVAGVGTEYALTNNITAKLEYLYYDLGKSSLTANATNAAAIATGIKPALSQSNNGTLLRTGLNYKF